MEPTSHAFRENARRAIADPRLSAAMRALQRDAPKTLATMRAGLPEFDALRHEARKIRDHVLENLDYYLERFEDKVVETGGHVHWCATAAEARDTVLGLCRAVDAHRITKSKSMVTEEIGLGAFLTARGLHSIETDLGEYILQLAGEAPSHIVAPAIHKTKAEISDLFLAHHRVHGFEDRCDDAEGLIDQARRIMRREFLNADVGITGANFLVAETGASVIVTNEGNGDLTQCLPDTHIVVAGIEKLVPTLDDTATLIRVLARSAARQEITVYTTFSAGPRRPGDRDGPRNFHVVLLDNGRAGMLSGGLREMLRCIRCGACMNHCPVYGIAGGHAYGWVYPGPMGAVLDPVFLGLEEARHLPAASTFCGRCEQVCPVEIPLPKLLRHWRRETFERGLAPASERHAIRLWGWLARRPRLYRLAAGLVARLLHAVGWGRGHVKSMPLAGGWTRGRDLPLPEGRTFIDQWRRRSGGRP